MNSGLHRFQINAQRGGELIKGVDKFQQALGFVAVNAHLRGVGNLCRHLANETQYLAEVGWQEQQMGLFAGLGTDHRHQCFGNSWVMAALDL